MANTNQSGGGSRGDSNRDSRNTDRDNVSKRDNVKRGLDNEEEIRDVSNESENPSTEKRDRDIKGMSGSSGQNRGGNLGNERREK